jgi:hypothetical protein
MVNVMKKSGTINGYLFNVCICCDFDIDGGHGGAERVKNLAKNVADHNARVLIMNRRIKRSLSSLLFDNDKYYEMSSDILVEHSYPFCVTFLFPGLIKLAQDCLTKIFAFFSRSPQSEINIFRVMDPYLFVKLFYVTKKEGVDLIQAELPQTLFISNIVKKLLNIPIIYDSHNVETIRAMEAGLNPFLVYLIKKTEMNACGASDLVFAVSENDKKLFTSLNIPDKKNKSDRKFCGLR